MKTFEIYQYSHGGKIELQQRFDSGHFNLKNYSRTGFFNDVQLKSKIIMYALNQITKKTKTIIYVIPKNDAVCDSQTKSLVV